MKTILIYFVLLAFLAEQFLGLSLTNIKGLSLMNLSLYLLLIAWAFTIVSKRRIIETNNVNKYLILFVLVIVTSIPIKILLDEIPEINLFHEIVTLKNWMNPLLFFFALSIIIDDERTCKRSLWGLIALLVLTVSAVLLAMFDIVTIGTVEVSHGGRAGVGDQNQYAAFLVLLMPLLLSFMLFQKNVLIKSGSAIFYFIGFIGLIGTGSRGGFIAFLFSMIGCAIILNRQQMINKIFIFFMIVLVFAMGVASYVVAPPSLKETIKQKADITQSKDLDEYTSGRIMIWKNGLKLFIQSPIFGYGRGSFVPLMKKQFHIHANSHNDYLLHLVNYGIIGFFLFIMIYVQIFRHVSYHLKMTTNHFSKMLYISYITGFIGYAVAMFGVNVIYPRYIFWIYTAIVYKYSGLESSNRITEIS